VKIIQNLKPVLLAILIALPAVPVAASAQRTGMPAVRTLTPQEQAIATGLAPVTLAQLNLRPSAMVVTETHVPGSTKQVVQRRNLGVDAAVYASVPYSDRPLLPRLPPAQPGPAAAELFEFATEGDSVQGWATMTAAGVPHLHLWGFGEFRSEATAGWTSRFTLGGSTSKEVVLRFVIPATTVSGATEDDAPAWWRSQLRADVLMNGFPIWSTEAVRLRADYVQTGTPGPDDKALLVLQQFGAGLDFPTDDEDAATTNDSNAGNVELASEAKEVFLSLGRFNPGQVIELQMILRGMAYTQARPGPTGDPRCETNPAGGYFCSRASMSVSGAASDGPQLRLLP
jgi:hypothetical protein